FVSMTDGVLKYSPATALEKRAGDVLYFKNGLAVNLALTDAAVNRRQDHMQIRPQSLFYMKDDELKEKVCECDRLDVSALLIQDGETYRAVMADPALVRSLMFRLYYLKGEGLKLFKPFSRHNDPLTDNEVDIFELRGDTV